MGFDIAPCKPPLMTKEQPKPICAGKVFDELLYASDCEERVENPSSIPTIRLFEDDQLRILQF